MNPMPTHVKDSVTHFCEMSNIDSLEPSDNVISILIDEDIFNLEYGKNELFAFYVFEINPFEIDGVLKHALKMSNPEIHFPLEIRVGLMGERHIVYSTNIVEAEVTPSKISFVFETLLAQKEALYKAMQT
jgi:hypothetical protein